MYHSNCQFIALRNCFSTYLYKMLPPYLDHCNCCRGIKIYGCLQELCLNLFILFGGWRQIHYFQSLVIHPVPV